MCLTEHALRQEEVLRYGCDDPSFIEVPIRWRIVVSLAPWQLWPTSKGVRWVPKPVRITWRGYKSRPHKGSNSDNSVVPAAISRKIQTPGKL
jgi:hypothetical protein